MRNPRAFSYLRFSNPDQQRGDSVRRQVSASKEWCDRNNVLLDDSLSLADCGVSAFRGKNADHGAFKEFLIAVDSGRVHPGDYLIVESLDRISRQELGKSQTLIHQILSSGVNIVTIKPERVFTPSGSNDIGQAIEILIHLSRAYEESKLKSERVGAAWEQKRNKATTQIISSKCPSWLRRVDNVFELIDDHVSIVRRIFDMADSIGAGAIANILNGEKLATFRFDEPNRKTKTRWRTSTIRRILTDRTVLGEYQPHKRMADGRVPVGRPIVGYYPAIIDESQFNRVQLAIASRKATGGAATKKISNLFTGLLFDKKGEPYVYRESNPSEVYLRTPTNSMPYELFEATMLLWAGDLDFEAVVPKDQKSTITKIGILTDKLAVIDLKIAEGKGRIKASKDGGGSLWDMLQELDADRLVTTIELDNAKLGALSSASDALVRIKELLVESKDIEDHERLLFRGRLRRHLRRIIRRIVVRSHRRKHGGYSIGATVFLANDAIRPFGVVGTIAKFATRSHDVPVPKEWFSVGSQAKFPEHGFGIDVEGSFERVDSDGYRFFDLETMNASLSKFRNYQERHLKILSLGKAGLPLDLIATEVGVSITKVSRTLIKGGLRRQSMKPKEHPYIMNWHPQGCGWVKTKDKQRFFVGCGTLRKLYPNLVVGDGCSDGDTWEAANQWWHEHVLAKTVSA